MPALRIFRWDDAPLPWRLMLAHLSGDSAPRTHLALVPEAQAADWRGERPPVAWADLVTVTIKDASGMAGVRSGELLVAGNENGRRHSQSEA